MYDWWNNTTRAGRLGKRYWTRRQESVEWHAGKCWIRGSNCPRMWCKLPFSDKCAASECFAYTCRASEPPTRVPADLDTHIRKFKPRAMGSPRRRCCTADGSSNFPAYCHIPRHSYCPCSKSLKIVNKLDSPKDHVLSKYSPCNTLSLHMDKKSGCVPVAFTFAAYKTWSIRRAQ